MIPFDPKHPEERRSRFRPIPVRLLVPNVITLLAICAGLTAIRLSTEGRMERFNATMDDPNKPAFAANFFTGVPAPAGAITVLLPIYLGFLGVPMPPATLTAFYTLLIGFLMVSRLPVFSGKTVRMRVPPEMVLPVFVSVVFRVALLIGYPWHILSAGSALYLLSLPAGWNSYRDHQRNAAAQGALPADAAASNPAAPPIVSPVSEPDQHDRPARLN